jgi:hypothetical protein
LSEVVPLLSPHCPLILWRWCLNVNKRNSKVIIQFKNTCISSTVMLLYIFSVNIHYTLTFIRKQKKFARFVSMLSLQIFHKPDRACGSILMKKARWQKLHATNQLKTEQLQNKAATNKIRFTVFVWYTLGLDNHKYILATTILSVQQNSTVIHY